MAKAGPEWKQTFCLECAGSIGDCNVICELQKQFVRFELRERSSRIRVLGNMFRASKLEGWVEIAWKDLLASPTLSINDWFPLIPFNTIISGGSQLPPSLHVAISIKPLILVDSVSQPPKEYRTEMEIYDPQVNEIRRNRCIRRVERSNCRCGGKVCCTGIHGDSRGSFIFRMMSSSSNDEFELEMHHGPECRDYMKFDYVSFLWGILYTIKNIVFIEPFQWLIYIYFYLNVE